MGRKLVQGEGPQGVATIEEKQAALDAAASFETLIDAGQEALQQIHAGWAQVLEGIAKCTQIVAEQKLAYELAKQHAADNTIATDARELGYEPLVAHSMYAMRTLPYPSVMRPMFFVAQYPNPAELLVNIQLTLNNGQPVIAQNGQQDPEAIALALLAGCRPAELQSGVQSTPWTPSIQEGMSTWFGLRPKPQAAE